MAAGIRAIEYHLPERVLSNGDLSAQYPDWNVEKIESKTGIRTRRIAGDGECSSDLAVAAARRLFDTGVCEPRDIDFVLLCTQSPDYFLPTTACLIQDRLGIPTTAGALDFNLGCSGFVYGLGLAKGLIETRQARHVLLLTAETYSKFLGASDRSVRTIFGDAGAAVLVSDVDAADGEPIGPFVYGTNGAGAENLIVKHGAARHPALSAGLGELHMNGAEVFAFSMQAVPAAVGELLARTGLAPDDVDLYVFHQANRHMLEQLRRKLAIPAEKFCIDLQDCGNTVSATIPIALKRLVDAGKVRRSDRVMVVGFGVGYSWSAAFVRLHGMRGAV